MKDLFLLEERVGDTGEDVDDRLPSEDDSLGVMGDFREDREGFEVERPIWERIGEGGEVGERARSIEWDCVLLRVGDPGPLRLLGLLALSREPCVTTLFPRIMAIRFATVSIVGL